MARMTIKANISSIVVGMSLVGGVGSASASALVPQTPIPGACIPQFAVSLPVFGPADGIPRVDAVQHPKLTVTMKEIDQNVLTGLNDTCGLNVRFGPTRVWAYGIADTDTGKQLAPANWPAVTVETKRNLPTTMTYVNKLPRFGETVDGITGLVQGLVTTDQTIHWADPFGAMCMAMAPDCTLPANATDPCCQPYYNSPPATVHLHGGEVPSTFDGGPESWFTPASNPKFGASYNTVGPRIAGQATYIYPNSQDAGTLFFHDHALGATRTNVYSGMAAFYFIRDKLTEPKALPSGPYEIEMALQDRQFDTNGQLFFPDGSTPLCGSGSLGDPCLNGPPPNPDLHPFWIPEFVGDVVMVNGAPWPKLKVEPRRYHFRVVDGSNARMYNMTFGNTLAGEPSPTVYVIGSDDNYLDKPTRVNTVFVAPGERADLIVDFTGLAGKKITVTNDAPVPFPSGLIPGSAGQEGMLNVMQFDVSLPLTGSDTSCDPTKNCRRPTPLVRLTDGKGNLAPGVKIDRKRQLVLKEHEGPGGPVEVLVNNTKWNGLKSLSIAAVFPEDGISELPEVGTTELWEIINLTMDAHPMHTHLSQFQILNREPVAGSPDTGGGYFSAWGAAFGSAGSLPSECTDPSNPLNPCPGYGPPLRYDVKNADGALGGNPALSPFLTGSVTPPAPWESGWKDTAKALPGQVTRLVVRWAPTYQQKSEPGKNFYPFDPTEGPGYVWHCHIIDHEDNEMMRPYKVSGGNKGGKK